MKVWSDGSSKFLNVNSQSKFEEIKNWNRVHCRDKTEKKTESSSNSRSFLELSVSVIFILWCLFFAMLSKLGLGYENADRTRTDKGEVLLELAKCSNCNRSDSCNNKLRANNSLPPEYGLEDVLLGEMKTLVCELNHGDNRNVSLTRSSMDVKATGSNTTDFHEMQNVMGQGSSKDLSAPLVSNITHSLELDGSEYNYASAMKGAKVVAHNKDAKGAGNILGKDYDKYLRNPCSVANKFVVIELSEETLVDAVKIANFEHYSSNLKDFNLSGSLTYPTDSWFPLGKFVASNMKQMQTFKLPEPKWLRYLKLNIISHYGSEFYCTLSVVEVYGVDAIERMLEDLLVASGEPHPHPAAASTSKLNPEMNLGVDRDEGDREYGSKTNLTGSGNAKEVQNHNEDVPKKRPLNSDKKLNPALEARHQPAGRIPSDSVLKILMQKVKVLELTLFEHERYFRDLERRQKEVVPELSKEITGILMLLEKTKAEATDLMHWKEKMEKELLGLELWKALVSSRVDLLARENRILRLDVEKIGQDQVSLEAKELGVLALSLFFVCLATLRLICLRISMFLGASQPRKGHQIERGWALVLLSSTMTIFITLLS